MNSSNRLPSAADSCRRLAAAVTAMLLAFPLASCSRGPAPVRQPSIDAGAAGNAAIGQYDTNGDGKVAGEELDAVPGLKSAMATVDIDNDEQVSAGEIVERIRTWQGSQIGVARVLCSVTMDGQPLAEATVTFEPESFLGDEIQAGSGVTDALGIAYPRIPKEKRPVPDMPPGLQLGFYRVRVSKLVNGQETIPVIYNKETILGQQIAPDDPALMSHKIQLNLKSR